MDNIKKFAGSVSQDDFVLGLLLARGVETSGDIWEKLIECNHCKFAKQCAELSAVMEAQDKNPRCGQIIDILLGEISPDDKSIEVLPHYPEDGKSFL